MTFWLSLLLLFQVSTPAVTVCPGPEDVTPDYAFALKDLETGEETVWGPQGQERRPPFSTFKIPNFLIALETGQAINREHPLPYSPERRPEQTWWAVDWAQDQTLETAFRRSAAWAFQDLALGIGEEAYGRYLEDFGYGNQAHRGDAFWLDRSLLISAPEQAKFLERLLTGELSVSEQHLEELRHVALFKEKSGYRLYGKTGAGPIREGDFSGSFEGWFVGWLERPDAAPVVFAYWTCKGSFAELKDFRASEAQRFLKVLEHLPGDW